MRGGGIHRWILAGLAAGLVAGLAANLTTASSPEARAALRSVVEQVLAPLGGIFLRLLFLTVLPLVFSCLALGVRELGNPRELGKIGLKTLVFTLILSGTSVAIGLGAVNLIRPGDNITSEARQSLLENARKESTAVATKAAQGDERPRLERLVHAVIPRNPVESAARAFDGDMLAVMCFALLFGVALAACGSERTGALVAFLEGLYDVSMWLVGFALTLAPVGVALLVFSMSSLLGTQIIVTLGAYVATVLAGLILQQFVVYPLILKFACGVSPRRFFSEIRPVMVTAFSTSSSNATLPTTLHVAQTRLGIPPRIANFVLTLGSTFNQNGTAL
ncbi:MAG TPA: dicarboxylate/amino acid:cation symporter, partial [Planctomycetota bacterium]|nr:dicarboxylate/amino acid:cation symporter [Planctomycetota bacterium]